MALYPNKGVSLLTTQPFITETRLVSLLGVDRSTLRRWRAKGYLQATIINQVPHYNIALVNYFLAASEHNLDSPLTIEQLLSGKRRLVSTAETCEQLGLSHFSLLVRIHSNRLRAIKIGAYFRVCAQSISEYQQKQDTTSSLPQDVVCHIFGVTIARVVCWMNDNELQRIPDVHNRARQISAASVLNFLEKTLPPWIKPSEWLQACLEDRRPLMNRTQLAFYLGIPANGPVLNKLIQEHKLWYLKTPGSKISKFLPKTADEAKEQFRKI